MIAILFIVLISTYFISKIRFRKKSKLPKNNIEVNYLQPYVSLIKNNPYRLNKIEQQQSLNIRYIKKSNYINKNLLLNPTEQNKKTRYTVINELLKKEFNNYKTSF
ncbi:MAG: hypothetical protein N2249_02225 [Melioribacter sp.]|nr:hypothetical protein [Melioribacter sp.]